MRLFTGISIPDNVIGSLERLQAKLKPTARINWSPPENFHITTKFIGQWPETRLEELKEALSYVPTPGLPLTIRISGLGWFPNPHSPRVFFAAIHAPAQLEQLAADTDAATTGLGIEKEARKFSPHLTLARIKEPDPLVEMKRTVAALPSVDFGEFTADRFYLYLSETSPAGSVYTQLAEFPFSSK